MFLRVNLRSPDAHIYVQLTPEVIWIDCKIASTLAALQSISHGSLSAGFDVVVGELSVNCEWYSCDHPIIISVNTTACTFDRGTLIPCMSVP